MHVSVHFNFLNIVTEFYIMFFKCLYNYQEHKFIFAAACYFKIVNKNAIRLVKNPFSRFFYQQILKWFDTYIRFTTF